MQDPLYEDMKSLSSAPVPENMKEMILSQTTLAEGLKKHEPSSCPWPLLFIWLSTAAVLFIVLSPLFREGKPDNIEKLSGHYSVENDIRYVGIVGKSAVLEINGKDGKSKQKTAKKGDVIEGWTVKAIDKDKIELLKGDKKVLLQISANPSGKMGKEHFFTIRCKVIPRYKSSKYQPGGCFVSASADGKTLQPQVERQSGEFCLFTIKSRLEIPFIRANYGEHCIVKTGPFNKDQEVVFDFSTANYIKITGTVFGPDKKPLRGKNENVPYLNVYAYHEKEASHNDGLISAPVGYLDKEGRYTLEAIAPVGRLEARYQCYRMVETGNWEKDSTVDFQMRSITISGNVKNHLNTPFPNAEIRAYDNEGNLIRPLGFARGEEVLPSQGHTNRTAVTDKDGNYSFSTNLTVDRIETKIFDVPLKMQGPWERDSTVNFWLGKNNSMSIKGKLLNNGGKHYFISEEKAKWIRDGMGEIVVQIFALDKENNIVGKSFVYEDCAFDFPAHASAIKILLVGNDVCLLKEGPFDAEGSMDFDVKNMGAKNVNGRIIGLDGKPVVTPNRSLCLIFGCPELLAFEDENLPSSRADDRGEFHFFGNIKPSELFVSFRGSEKGANFDFPNYGSDLEFSKPDFRDGMELNLSTLDVIHFRGKITSKSMKKNKSFHISFCGEGGNIHYVRTNSDFEVALHSDVNKIIVADYENSIKTITEFPKPKNGITELDIEMD